MGFERISDTPVEARHHAIGSGRAWLAGVMRAFLCRRQSAGMRQGPGNAWLSACVLAYVMAYALDYPVGSWAPHVLARAQRG